MNPHKPSRLRFVANVTIRKICNENSWWYNSCQKCFKGARPYGYTYKCSSCSWIGMAVPRYKFTVIAGDDTVDAEFVLFGRIAQRLVRKPVEVLIEQTPEGSDFIPDEITGLLEKEFIWNVSFTENTLRTGIVSFQVNSVQSMGATGQPPMLMSPTGSQASSAMMSPGSSSMLLSPTRTSEVACASPPSGATASPVAKQSVGTPKKQTFHSPAHQTPTSKYSCAPVEQKAKAIAVSVDDMVPIAASTASKSATKKRGRPSQASPTVKKLFSEDNKKDTTDSASGDA